MDHKDAEKLRGLRVIAEIYNRVLSCMVDEAAKIIPYDLASDYIYEVIDFDCVEKELENELGIS